MFLVCSTRDPIYSYNIFLILLKVILIYIGNEFDNTRHENAFIGISCNKIIIIYLFFTIFSSLFFSLVAN